MELLSYKNITEKEEQAIVAFLTEFVIITINEKIKLSAIKIKETTIMKLPDSIIAATAISLNLPLLTSDRQFTTVKNLNLVYYEK